MSSKHHRTGYPWHKDTERPLLTVYPNWLCFCSSKLIGWVAYQGEGRIFKLISLPWSKTQEYIVGLQTSKGRVTLSLYTANPLDCLSSFDCVFLLTSLLVDIVWLIYKGWKGRFLKKQGFYIERGIFHKHPKKHCFLIKTVGWQSLV